MAFNLSLTRDKTYELLDLSLRNGAKPVAVLEDPDEIAHEMFIDLLFSERKDTCVLEYGNFIMEQAFSVEGMKQLSNYRYIIIENVKHLYGKSATSRILADFVKYMTENDAAVIFIGKRAVFDMAEFIELADEYIQYIITVDSEE